MNKAFDWLLVAVGGLCIATKETYELAHCEIGIEIEILGARSAPVVAPILRIIRRRL